MLSFVQYLKEEHFGLTDKPRKVGKRIGGDIYVHRDWTHHAGISHSDLEDAKKHLPKDHKYTIVKHNPKEGTFSFIHSHDFESAHEPTVGKSIKVHRDGRTTETAQKKDPQIYHHKWEMVGDNHGGFDVAKSKARSKHWRGVVGKNPEVSSRIGTKSYWDKEVVPKLEEDFKGWMSPSGKAHLFDADEEHAENHHPEYKAINPKAGQDTSRWHSNNWTAKQIAGAQKKGFVRYGKAKDSIHGHHVFVHYDERHPQGHKTAYNALRDLNLHHDEPVTISGIGKSIYNPKVKKELGNDRTMRASEAMRHLHQKANGISEDVVGDKIKKATKSNASYKILDSHPSTEGSTWNAGGCGVLAHALHKHLPGSRLVDIHNKTTGNTEHVAVHHGDHVYDGYGATPAKHFITKYRKREMLPAHHDLEMTDHHPARTAKSEISTHPDPVAKMHAHLKQHLDK